MKKATWQLRLGAILLLLALFFDGIHYWIFADADYIFKFILAQLGFLPISVFLVTVIINQLLGRRERQIMLNKLNMVIGSFFSQVGSRLLHSFAQADTATDKLSGVLLFSSQWQHKDYVNAKGSVESFAHAFTKDSVDWLALRNFLMVEKTFLLGLLGNPNLLEHESFTELLWAVFHLAEELACRKNFIDLPTSDYEHLIGDIKRAYDLLINQWLAYTAHLQTDYPYLFSLAVRTNPFDINARPEIIS